MATEPNTREKQAKREHPAAEESGQLKFIEAADDAYRIDTGEFDAVVNGHTDAQMCPSSNTGERLWYSWRISCLLRVIYRPYVMGYDTRPLITR